MTHVSGLLVASGAMAYGGIGGARLNRFVSDTYSQKSSVPDGYGASTPFPALTPGGASVKLSGAGGVDASAILALELMAMLGGEGGIDAAGGLIVNLLATLAGSGGITSAQMQAFLSLVATISGAGGVIATGAGIGSLLSELIGSGGAAGVATGLGSMGANLRGYGDLTPEGLRDAVWSAIASQYDEPGSMGQKLNNSASGGVDYTALGQAVWAHATRTLTSSSGTAPTAAEVTAAVLAALQATTIPVNIEQVNGQTINGTGTEANPWGP